MKKFLITGLGNPGPKYKETRHNIGFKVLDQLCLTKGLEFTPNKLGDTCILKHKGRTFFLLKPNTYMNLSGKAINYWLQKENIAIENLLVVTDDLNLDFGTLRLKGKGSHGGHNGLKHIQETLNSSTYPRFRFGVGSQFSKGQQIDYVLGEWNAEELKQLNERIEKAGEGILSFGLAGINNTMNQFNGK